MGALPVYANPEVVDLSASSPKPTRAPHPMRADARRNYERILAAAEAVVARHGADASFEEIARTSGVGSATVYRHFPTRSALLEEVFHERVAALADRARVLADSGDARTVLTAWLGEVCSYLTSANGLAAALAMTDDTFKDPDTRSCFASLADAGAPLLQRAVEEGAARPSADIRDLLVLANGISLATEHHEDNAAEAQRLLLQFTEGIWSPARS
ncbi:MAG: TetR/AcrR family transcriptional regulator [Nocardiopsis sp. BM-2018]|nr:MAG: TetR/AcrR family transcriptional regulator [Nocardiopsis sp. BM-2018]